MDCSVGKLLKYYCYSKMHKCVDPSEVISSKQKKKTKQNYILISYQKQANTKQSKQIAKTYQKERKKNQHEYHFYRSDLVLYT